MSWTIQNTTGRHGKMTVKYRVGEQVEEAEAHWPHIAPLLSEITDEGD